MNHWRFRSANTLLMLEATVSLLVSHWGYVRNSCFHWMLRFVEGRAAAGARLVSWLLVVDSESGSLDDDLAELLLVCSRGCAWELVLTVERLASLAPLPFVLLDVEDVLGRGGAALREELAASATLEAVASALQFGAVYADEALAKPMLADAVVGRVVRYVVGDIIPVAVDLAHDVESRGGVAEIVDCFVEVFFEVPLSGRMGAMVFCHSSSSSESV